MSLVTLKDVLPPARRAGHAVGAFNIANYETACAVIDAAEAEKSPVIMQIYQRLMDDPHIGALAAMMRRMAEDASVPVVVHLDHGATLEQVEKALRLGFSSVMFDGSKLPFDENAKGSAAAAKMAAAAGASAEAEIGHVPLSGADDVPLPSAEEAAEFAAKTGVDALAVAVGTVHGFYKSEPKIDLGLAREAGRLCAAPLVLHGGSGTPGHIVRELVSAGFAKVNVATEFQHEFMGRLGADWSKNNGAFVPLDKLARPAREEAAALLRRFIRIFAGRE
jgi:ketose-bisphosphate aldolase